VYGEREEQRGQAAGDGLNGTGATKANSPA